MIDQVPPHFACQLHAVYYYAHLSELGKKSNSMGCVADRCNAAA
jgi:hypothetical protein